jgi:hypothetical protein
MGIVISVLLILAMISLLFLRSSGRNKYVSEITSVLVSSFPDREKVLEFRVHEERARSKIREFEVKTIRQSYYVVRMKGRKILSKTTTSHFTVQESESLLIGILDPVSLDRYQLKVRDSELDKL